VNVILAAVRRFPTVRARREVASIRVTLARRAGCGVRGPVLEEELTNELGDSVGNGAGGLPAAVAGVAAVGDATAAGGVTAAGGATAAGGCAGTGMGRGMGTGGAGGIVGAGGGGGGGVVGIGRETVGSDTVMGGKPTSPRACAESTPAAAATKQTAIIRATVGIRRRFTRFTL
jgi:hypothetical protein